MTLFSRGCKARQTHITARMRSRHTELSELTSGQSARALSVPGQNWPNSRPSKIRAQLCTCTITRSNYTLARESGQLMGLDKRWARSWLAQLVLYI